jgi:hypothetical protein
MLLRPQRAGRPHPRTPIISCAPPQASTLLLAQSAARCWKRSRHEWRGMRKRRLCCWTSCTSSLHPSCAPATLSCAPSTPLGKRSRAWPFRCCHRRFRWGPFVVPRVRQHAERAGQLVGALSPTHRAHTATCFATSTAQPNPTQAEVDAGEGLLLASSCVSAAGQPAHLPEGNASQLRRERPRVQHQNSTDRRSVVVRTSVPEPDGSAAANDASSLRRAARAEREAQWAALLASKPDDAYQSPEDAEAVRQAAATIGDLRLRSAAGFVPDEVGGACLRAGLWAVLALANSQPSSECKSFQTSRHVTSLPAFLLPLVIRNTA